MHEYATDRDRMIIDAVSVALKGSIGGEDDTERLQKQLLGSDDKKLKTACEIAIAFIRWAQDLKHERNHFRTKLENQEAKTI